MFGIVGLQNWRAEESSSSRSRKIVLLRKEINHCVSSRAPAGEIKKEEKKKKKLVLQGAGEKRKVPPLSPLNSSWKLFPRFDLPHFQGSLGPTFTKTSLYILSALRFMAALTSPTAAVMDLITSIPLERDAESLRTMI